MSTLPPESVRGLAQRLLPFACLAGLALPACSDSSSVLAPASADAGKIADLFWMVFGVGAMIFVVVAGLLVYSVVRFRARPGSPEPAQVHGNLRLEIAWTLLPVVIVAGIFGATVSTMSAVAQRQPGALRVQVIGHQWWWEINYPDLGITTATDLHVPAGRPVEVELLSADVVHSFWAPELFGKTDVFPGQTNWTRFAADRPGIYRGRCAEFCGTQHANMGFLVVAETPEQFDNWAARAREPSVLPASEEVGRGAQAFLSRGCAWCHTIDGTAAQGKLGPNLTRFGSRRTIAALTLDNTTENLTSWLAGSQTIKPGTKMPDPKLSREMIRDLVAYLEALK